jgi:hypothetical protein
MCQMRIPFAALHQILKAIASTQSKNMRDFYATCVQCTGLFTFFSSFPRNQAGCAVKMGDIMFEASFDLPLPAAQGLILSRMPPASRPQVICRQRRQGLLTRRLGGRGREVLDGDAH